MAIMKKRIQIFVTALLLMGGVRAQVISSDTLTCGVRQHDLFYPRWYDTAHWYLNPDDPLSGNQTPEGCHFILFSGVSNDSTITPEGPVMQYYTADTIRVRGLWAMVSHINGFPDWHNVHPSPTLRPYRLPEYLYLYERDTTVVVTGEYAATRHLIRRATVRWDTAHPQMLCLTKTADGRFGSEEFEYCHLYRAMFEKDTVVTIHGEFWIGGSCHSNLRHPVSNDYEYFPSLYLSWGNTDQYGWLDQYLHFAYGTDPDGPWYWRNDPTWTARGCGPFGCIVDQQRLVQATSADTAQGVAQYTAYYPDSSYQTIRAVARHGYRFAHWNDGDTANPRTILVTQDTVFTAYFEDMPLHRVSLAVNDGSLGYVTGDSTYFEGDSATLTATATQSWSRFARWDDGSRENPRILVVTQDTSFTALFGVDSSAFEGIGGPEAVSLFTLTPNPARESVTVTLEGAALPAEITVYDAAGHAVLERRAATRRTRLSTRSLPAGHYFVTVATPRGTATQKLTIL